MTEDLTELLSLRNENDSECRDSRAIYSQNLRWRGRTYVVGFISNQRPRSTHPSLHAQTPRGAKLQYEQMQRYNLPRSARLTDTKVCSTGQLQSFSATFVLSRTGSLCIIRPIDHYGPTEICPRSGPNIGLIALNNHFVMNTCINTWKCVKNRNIAGKHKS